MLNFKRNYLFSNIFLNILFAGSLVILTCCQTDKTELFNDQIFNIEKVNACEIPIKEINHMLVVECLVNNIKAKLIIDTGSNVMCIFENRYSKFNAKVIGSRSSGGYTAGGPSHGYNILDKLKYQFGDDILFEVQMVDIIPAYPYDADGMIGVTLLKILGAKIDFKTMTLKIDGLKSSNIQENIKEKKANK